MQIQPLSDRVVVRPLSTEQVSKSGIVIPDTAKEKPQEGEVIAVGPGKWNEDGDKRIAMQLKVGDKVIFESWSGKDYKVDGVEYKILREDDVMGVIK
ncbi:co-chaperone GroES [Candidatus Berkelbacteria bacterium]|nr:co-chaperone GroES [Candidatus Berkelbacteria bacterium]